MTLHAYSRVPQQERSRLSFDRVLDGATRLLEENGYEGFNITDVSRISKVSIGSIYARVDSKEDLLRAVQDRVLTQVDADHLRWTDPELWKNHTLTTMLPAVVKNFSQSLSSHAAIFRALIARAQADPIIQARGSRTHSLLLDRFSQLLLQRRVEIRHSNPEHAVRFCGGLLWASFAAFLGIENPVTASDGKMSELIDDLSEMCLIYLINDRAPTKKAPDGKMIRLAAPNKKSARKSR
jgi:AcrR family transcriptional regulator